MSDGIREDLVKHICRVLKRDVDADECLIDQFNINKLLNFVKNFYDDTGIELDVNSFFLWNSASELATAIENKQHRRVPKLIRLRPGDEDRPLLLFAGGVSCFMEVKWLLEGLDYDGAVYGMCLSRFEAPHSAPATVAHEVSACLAELAKNEISGPVKLLGYSFGGIVALELSKGLAACGQKVDFLGLIDTNQSEHAWPFPVWLQVVGRKILARFQKTAVSVSPFQAEARTAHARQPKRPRRSFIQKLNPILFRFYDPRSETYPELAPEFVDGHPPDYDHRGRQLLRMRGLYRPGHYDGPLVFYRATGGLPHRCDARKVWSPFLPAAEWIDIRGNHISAIYGKNGIALGRDIASKLTSKENRNEMAGDPSAVRRAAAVG